MFCYHEKRFNEKGFVALLAFGC
ncbi:hypothetical protein EMIT0P43_150086 [Pseudomonas jessenii]